MSVNDLYPKIAEASLNKPNNFAETFLEILCAEFHLKAASFYTYQPQTDVLILRGQSRLDYALYRSFELPSETLAAEAIKQLRAVWFTDLETNPGYRDKELVREFQLKSLLVVPIPSHTPSESIPIGVVCLYPHAAITDASFIADRIVQVAPFISILYTASLDQRKMRLRQALVKRAGYSHEMGGLLRRIIESFRDELHVQAGSIFILDDRNNFLRLRATTGIKEKIPLHTHFRPDSLDITNQAFRSNHLVLLGKTEISSQLHGPIETTNDPPTNCLLYPIQEAAAQQEHERSVLGIFRVLNHTLEHSGVRKITTFGWEELRLIEFFAELTAVMTHFMKKGDNAKDDFERRMHGAKNNLQAVQFSLELLETANLQLPSYMDTHAISNSIAFLEDIRAQVQRLDLRQKLELSEIHLYKEVLSKIPMMVQRTSEAYKIGGFHITNFKMAGFDQLPAVHGNRDALLCVFRNLAENAIKYCNPDKWSHRLLFEPTISNGSLFIRVSNDGVRVSDIDSKFLFVEGFRTDDAIARHPSSNGLGLADAKDLLERMGGSIAFEKDKNKTTFLIELKLMP